MALKKDYVDDRIGHTYTDAYYKIQKVDFAVDRYVVMTVECYVNQTQREAGKQPIIGATKNYAISKRDQTGNVFDDYFAVSELDTADQNIINQSYEYLKTLDDFDDAVDV